MFSAFLDRPRFWRVRDTFQNDLGLSLNPDFGPALERAVGRVDHATRPKNHSGGRVGVRASTLHGQAGIPFSCLAVASHDVLVDVNDCGRGQCSLSIGAFFTVEQFKKMHTHRHTANFSREKELSRSFSREANSMACNGLGTAPEKNDLPRTKKHHNEKPPYTREPRSPTLPSLFFFERSDPNRVAARLVDVASQGRHLSG